jgi:hypothetical protein
MLTDALTWGRLRELWLDIYEYPEATNLDVKRHLYMALKAVAPIEIPDDNKGDCGWILFKDLSEIKYDWDEGHFECEDISLQYPWRLNDDPLFFDYTSDIGWYKDLEP